MKAVFWTSAIWLAWVYLGYPLFMAIVAGLRRRPELRGEEFPALTILIAAYNEAGCIEATVRNKLAQEYPPGKLDVVVVSDGSDDGTDEVVTSIDDPRVRLIRQEPRQGKTSALNLGVAAARGELIVISDANSMYEPGALRALAGRFADPAVGYVTGKMIYGNKDGTVTGDGCTAYMRYENWLRRHESRAGSVVGVDGGIDAFRRSLYRPMRADQLPDFVLPLAVVAAGYRVAYEPAAVVREEALADGGREYRMRVRVSLRALWALWDMRQLLNPLRHPMFSLQLWSHKLLRYLAFLPIIALALASVALWPQGGIYGWVAAGQAAFWFLALLGSLGLGGRLAGLPYYFGMLNWASAVAFQRFLRRQKQVTWQPRAGA